jgi:hypothetical protein
LTQAANKSAASNRKKIDRVVVFMCASFLEQVFNSGLRGGPDVYSRPNRIIQAAVR